MTQDQAFQILKTGTSVFLTGEPGSGKTHTVNRYAQYLRSQSITPSITASTGIAATHIGGMTIHSWSGIGIKTDITRRDIEMLMRSGRSARRVAQAKVLIIDEVSMLSARTFRMLDAVCRGIRGNDKPFGGLQVVLVGDFFQLPPVVRRDEIDPDVNQLIFNDGENQKNPAAQFAYESPAWEELDPVILYLSEQHRQEDAVFLDILSAMRRGTMTAEHKAYLALRKTPNNVLPENITKLFPHNMDVNRMNDFELGKLENETRTFQMTGTGQPKLVEQLKRGCLSPETLTLKIGAKVMFTKNNFDEGYVNGTTGTVVGFREDDDIPLIEIENGKAVSAEIDEWAIESDEDTLARINQVPLRLAWAITVHKSQGMSLDAAVINLAAAFEYGQGYVALSRLRSLAGLHLIGINTRALEVHPDIIKKDVEFRARSSDAEDMLRAMTPEEISSAEKIFIQACAGKAPTVSLTENIPSDKEIEHDRTRPANYLTAIREKHPNAYRPWPATEDAELQESFLRGDKTKVMAEKLGRQPGAIRSRLRKLGLIE